MRVGIITLFNNNYNYGAVLQAYALQKAVERLGYGADIIDYERIHSPINEPNLSYLKKFTNKVVSINSIGDIYNIIKAFVHDEKNYKEIDERKEKFRSFYLDKMCISNHYDTASIYMANNEYDAFICGSDQIWRPSSFDPNYYLLFAEQSKKRISFAASLGVKELNDEAYEKMMPLISRLNAVSVREKDAIDILKKGGIASDLVTDPTLLWKRDFWDEIVTKPDIKEKKYVLSYIIGENNRNRDVAKKIARMKKLPLVTIPGISRFKPYDFIYADRNITNASPTDFLGLIKNAAFVVTDSFHACVFSTVFETPFVALERFYRNDPNSMNGRIYDLLKLFSLENRLIKNNEKIDETLFEDYSTNYESLNQLREYSWGFLNDNLQETTSSCKE